MSSELWAPSPDFALSMDHRGRPFASRETFPYDGIIELEEGHRVLMACFEGTGTPVPVAVDAFLRLNQLRLTPKNRRLATRVASQLIKMNLLVRWGEGSSIYDASMAQAYREHRRVPSEVAEWIIAKGQIKRATRVLDIACGTGALANQIARASNCVTGMDVSSSFLDVARQGAKQEGLRVRYVQESGNRLTHHGESYDVATISLGFVWLDPYRAAAGIDRVLARGGSLFVLEARFSTPATHPLAHLFDAPPLKERARADYYNRLFSLIPAVGPRLIVRRHYTYEGTLPVSIPFARAFFSPLHLKLIREPGWRSPARYWERVALKTRSLPRSVWNGKQRWVALWLTR